MKLWIKNFLIALFGIFAAIGVHYVLFEFILGVEKPYFRSIYIFVFLILIISILLIQVLEKSFKEQLGYFFLIVVAFKLFAAKLFIDSFDEYQESEFKMSLLILYLISLILITWFTAKKLLNTES